MAKEKPLVKLNKKHGGKEFKNYFHFVGKVKPVRKQDENKEWYDVPYFSENKTKTDKQRRVLTFTLETAYSNDLKLELNGMEMKSVYPYSSAAGKSVEVPWADRNNKEKFPDNTYNVLGGTDWDNAEEFSKLIDTDKWIEVKGYYEFSIFTTDDGTPMVITKRMIKSLNAVESGQELKIDKDTKYNYVCDFNSPDFKEVNYFNLQIGIKSATQNENTGNTMVKAVVLSYGKERSKVEDAELIVYQKDVAEGKKSLADAFATLEYRDFIEIIGVDNNRAVISWVDVVDNFATDDPFADIDENEKTVRQEKVVTGEKKGLEIVSYVQKTKLIEYLKDEEMSNPVEENPFTSEQKDPFASLEDDPFAEDNDLPF